MVVWFRYDMGGAMDVNQLRKWHESQVKRISRLVADRKSVVTDDILEQHKFHREAAELVNSFADEYIGTRLEQMELECKRGAVESIENLGKMIIAESKVFRRMFEKDPND
jgi:hypothetical protein